MSDGRTHYADDETIAYIAKLEAERDEALQREAKNADKLKHYRMYFIPKLEAERDRLIQECEDLRIGSAAWEHQSQQLRTERDKLSELADALAEALERLTRIVGTVVGESRFDVIDKARAAIAAYRRQSNESV